MLWPGFDWIAVAVAAYLLGSLPTAYLVTQRALGQDIRRLGDGNAGAGNVYRSVSPWAGIVVAAADLARGAAAVWLASIVTGSTGAAMLAGVAVIAGHNWPLFLQFRGGRGAAPAVGALLVVLPQAALPLMVASLPVLLLFKSVTRALAFIYIGGVILAYPLSQSWAVAAYFLAVPVLVGVSHHLSVKRAARETGALQTAQAPGQSLP